jgi:hypothetical protein
LTHGQERLFRKVTSVSIHSFVEWLDTFSYVLRPADVTVKEVKHIRCFAIDIAKYIILLSCRLAMEHLCVLQLETAVATLVTTWFTLADRRWRSRYRCSDQCILILYHLPIYALRVFFVFFSCNLWSCCSMHDSVHKTKNRPLDLFDTDCINPNSVTIRTSLYEIFVFSFFYGLLSRGHLFHISVFFYLCDR